MPLPTIATPTYELTLPSNNKKVKYRPFLVKEEKILILAMESEDTKQITAAITDVLNACILTRGVKIDSLPTFDIEYLFLNVRAKSVGEVVDLVVTCEDDGETKVDISVNLDDIKVERNKKHKQDIKLDKNLSLRLKYPSMEQFIKSNFDFEGTNVDASFKMIAGCIDQIYTDEEAWPATDYSEKERIEFLDQLNTKQFKEVEQFFDTMPKLSHKLVVKNPNTGVDNNVVLEGLASFFV
jgi:uncharacterized lipoprotein YehR (DUF1307 family)|tara:strand:- start:75 stop:791 length:717 start_codon:yes stop_codon:yes gene_type:complete